MKRRTSAVSAILTMILILIAAIVGAAIAYSWTMAPFYLEPQNAVDLIITDMNFQVNNANYFGLTIMNPSHSVSAANITDISVTAPGFNSTSVTGSNPQLPFVLAQGTSQNFNCSLQWGALAGQLVTVHVSTDNGTGTERSIQTQTVTLDVNTFFNASKSVNYFNVSATLVSSPINLTINQVLFEFNPVNTSYLNITLPQAGVMKPGQTIGFTCYVPWEGYVNPHVGIETLEGYVVEKQVYVNGTALLQVTQVTFNSTQEIDVTLFNSPDSATGVDVSNITLTHGNVTDTIIGTVSNPTLPSYVDINQTTVFACTWNWNDTSYRSLSLNVTVNTRQGFATTLNVQTPAYVSAIINQTYFDVGDTGTFVLNATNMPYSLETVNVSRIIINNQNATFSIPTFIAPGTTAAIQCTFNWSNLVGQNVTIEVHFSYDSTETNATYNLRLPYFKISNATFGPSDNQLTMHTSQFSGIAANITQIQVLYQATPLLTIDSTVYTVPIGSDLIINYTLNWTPYVGQNVTFFIMTADGFQYTSTWTVQ